MDLHDRKNGLRIYLEIVYARMVPSQNLHVLCLPHASYDLVGELPIEIHRGLFLPCVLVCVRAVLVCLRAVLVCLRVVLVCLRACVGVCVCVCKGTCVTARMSPSNTHSSAIIEPRH